MRLFGKNPVIERLKANPKSVRRVLLELGHPDTAYVHKKCHQWGIPVASLPRSKIQKLARSLNTQGVLAEIDEFGYQPFEDMLDVAWDKKQTLVFLDNLTDPQNLGGILRTCGSLGDFAVVLPTAESVSVTETVLRVACGGENYLPVARVSNLANAIAKAKKKGFWIIGAVAKGASRLNEVRMQFPAGVVLGSEDKGIREIIRQKLDCEVMVPMKQERMSLNVAHAASIICWEVVRQRP
ncbi:MAG: 23S rRNA (guanosine(2251)-2'-O)-methyltransferase RlmB [Candidatus Omnitrophica bacterium]|nr:23S rRNA (guanosine(2251)-2'-O)-methyltransferase RlmB [Candidatus Omnitrophota bacterium]